MHAPVTSEATTTDPELAREVVATAYADTRLRVHGAAQDFRFGHRRVDLGQVSFDHNHNRLLTEYSMAPTGQVVMVRVLAGVIDTDDGVTRHRFGPGDVCLIAAPDRAQTTHLRDPRLQVTSLTPELLSTVDPEGVAVRMTRLRTGALDRENAARWQRMVDSVYSLVTRDPGVATDLVRGAAGRLLASTLIAIFDQGADDTRGSARRDATPLAVRRAIAFIETNPDLDLSTADIAKAAGVSVQAIELGFRRHRDCGPLVYLRRVRLDRVRRDLLDTDPAGAVETDTLSAVTARWGFAGTRTFDGFYRDAYGELPGDTLRS